MSARCVGWIWGGVFLSTLVATAVWAQDKKEQPPRNRPAEWGGPRKLWRAEGGRPERPRPDRDVRPGPAMRHGRIPDELVDFLKDVDPGMLEELEKMRDRNPERFGDVLGRAMRQMREMTRLREENPEAFEQEVRRRELDRDVRELAESYRKEEDEGKKAEMKQRLRAAFEEIFDSQIAQRKRSLEELQERMERYRKTLEKRQQNRDAIIEERMKDLTGENEGLRWEFPPFPPI